MSSEDHWEDVEKGSSNTARADHDDDASGSKAVYAPDVAGHGSHFIANDIEKRSTDSTAAVEPVISSDPGPPPDGGWTAWIQVLMAHIIIFNTWGYINSFGVFQVYHVQHLHRPPSDISWVGSIQIFLLFSIGTVSGRASDAGYFKHTFAAGLLMQLLGLFMTSLSKTYWQLFLAQGTCTGVGNGLLFCPSLAVLTTYFLKRRAIAVGLAACGTATGGVVFPLLAQHLLPRIHFGWTVRIMGCIMLVTMIFPLLLMRSRLPPRKAGPLVELAAFKEVPYLLFAIGNSLCFLGLYFTIYYVSTISHEHPMQNFKILEHTLIIPFVQISAYGIATFHITTDRSFTILVILNACGIAGRLLPNLVSDLYLGPLNTMIPVTLMSSLLIYIWIALVPPHSTLGGYMAWAGIYGLISSAVLSVFPAVCASLTPVDKLQKAGVRLGMVMTCISVSVLIGPPIGGALIQADHGRYLGAQLFFGSVLMVALGFLLALRVARVGWQIKVRT